MFGSSCRNREQRSQLVEKLSSIEPKLQCCSYNLANANLFGLVDVFMCLIKLGETQMAETQNSKSLGPENSTLNVKWDIKHCFLKHFCTSFVIFRSKMLSTTVNCQITKFIQ